YGWSGESVALLTEKLKEAKLDVVNDGIRELWNPNEEAVENCIRFGKDFAKKL
ncbi:MAG: anaerobic nitric oxide reductase flavorubredoxin, partial [Clostridiales bacterium]|nr:anaerobic nitric oxide reductase flavorubredoxin [Clostridiales bacterium]